LFGSDLLIIAQPSAYTTYQCKCFSDYGFLTIFHQIELSKICKTVHQ